VVSTTVSAVVPNRRPRIEGDREAEILDAAVRVLANVGYDRLTMDMVASEARAGKATLYRRWQNKAALVVDAVSRAKGIPSPDMPSTGTLRGDLLASWCGREGWSSTLPMSVMGGLMTALHNDEELGAAFREIFSGPRQALARRVFEDVRDRGEIADGVDLDLVMSLLPAVCVHHEFVLNRALDDVFVERVIDAVVLPACHAEQSTAQAGVEPSRTVRTAK
jgi:AcrR family transcriptional regulator